MPVVLNFVISAGRTATVFLQRALAERYGEVVSYHEPPPARREQLWGNLRNRTGWGAASVRRLFLRARTRRLQQLESRQVYVEVNPLLCPVVDLLPELGHPFRVVHVVREPASWGRSMLAFKASSKFRHVIDYIPFALPYPPTRPPKWHRLSKADRTLWRWRYCNEQIEQTAMWAAEYRRIRYEDLFAPELPRRRQAVADLVRGVGLEPAPKLDWWDRKQPVNAAPGRAAAVADSIDPAAVERICGELSARYGYHRR